MLCWNISSDKIGLRRVEQPGVCFESRKIQEKEKIIIFIINSRSRLVDSVHQQFSSVPIMSVKSNVFPSLILTRKKR